jgi:hypothetical protein
MRMRHLLAIAMALAFAGSATAQTTTVVSDTSTAKWAPSADDSAAFGTPPAPIVTKYIGELFLKSAVTNGIPNGKPVITLDFGKPAVAAGTQTSAPLKPMIQPGVEYVLFLSAVGPGGSSARTAASVPFGYPSAPAAVTSAVTITP